MINLLSSNLIVNRKNSSPHYSGFDKQMDVVNLYELAGHSPACFWIGGYESNPISNVNIYKKNDDIIANLHLKNGLQSVLSFSFDLYVFANSNSFFNKHFPLEHFSQSR